MVQDKKYAPDDHNSSNLSVKFLVKKVCGEASPLVIQQVSRQHQTDSLSLFFTRPLWSVSCTSSGCCPVLCEVLSSLRSNQWDTCKLWGAGLVGVGCQLWNAAVKCVALKWGHNVSWHSQRDWSSYLNSPLIRNKSLRLNLRPPALLRPSH